MEQINPNQDNSEDCNYKSCATRGCNCIPAYRMEVGGSGARYCVNCAGRILALADAKERLIDS